MGYFMQRAAAAVAAGFRRNHTRVQHDRINDLYDRSRLVAVRPQLHIAAVLDILRGKDARAAFAAEQYNTFVKYRQSVHDTRTTDYAADFTFNAIEKADINAVETSIKLNPLNINRNTEQFCCTRLHRCNATGIDQLLRIAGEIHANVTQALLAAAGVVTRFVDQKGLDLVEAVLPDILADDVRLIVLGTGDYRYEQMFIEAKRRWPDKVSASIMFSGDLANRIYAGADMFLMPSKFEPCGLAQMIALRYGTIPIVRETGGLKDTVHAFVDYAGTGNGFTFASYNAHDMLHVIREACGVFRFNKPAWSKLIMQGMQSDFSWGSSADKYIEVYKTAMGQ